MPVVGAVVAEAAEAVAVGEEVVAATTVVVAAEDTVVEGEDTEEEDVTGGERMRWIAMIRLILHDWSQFGSVL